MLTHKFRSGNSCDIHVPENIKPHEFNPQIIAWDHAPSAEDIEEYCRSVLPEKLLPAMARAVQKCYGPGSFMELMPGVWGWVSAGSRN